MNSYTNYLQNLLIRNKVYFKTEEEFHDRQKQLDVSREPPLKLNVKSPLTGALITRYSRQMLLKQIAYQGQLKLISAHVAVIGSGGIGCPLALYLAGAGVSNITLYDSDKVELTNLHRQIAHRTQLIGQSKTASLKQAMLQLNPHILITERSNITVENVTQLEGYDLVIDGSDNPQCRYIVNDFCMSRKKKLLSGACVGWEAQVTCYGGDHACYRCLWGDQQVTTGGCSALGVIGTLPGLVAMILGTEALKILLNQVSSLEGHLLMYDGLRCEFRKIKIRPKKQSCLACGKHKISMESYDYSRYGLCSNSQEVSNVSSISWEQFIHLTDRPIHVDCRPQQQFKIVHFTQSVNIPYEALVKMSKEDVMEKCKAKEGQMIAVSCAKGIMSKRAVQYLLGVSLKSCSVAGGIAEYGKLYDSDVPEL